MSAMFFLARALTANPYVAVAMARIEPARALSVRAEGGGGHAPETKGSTQ